MKSRKKDKEPEKNPASPSFFGKKKDEETFFQRKVEAKEDVKEKEEEEVQAKMEGSSSPGAATIAGGPPTGGGASLPGSTKSQMGSAFESGFDDVRIHTDNEAAAKSEELGAQAFTYGQDIYFNKGKFRPGTPEGDALLAHELAHTLQQKDALKGGRNFDEEAETEADNAAIGVVRSISDKNSNKKVQRKTKSKGLSLQRCSKKDTPAPAPAPMVDQLTNPPVKTDAGRTINVRGKVSHLGLKQDLARIDILGEGGGGTVDKVIGGKKTNVFEIKAFVINYTEDWVQKEFNTIFPLGSESLIESNDDPKLVALRGLIEKFRAVHPNSFSKLQGRNMMTGSCAGACIGTFNAGIEGLYGNQTVKEEKDMEDSAFGTINKLKEKKFITKSAVMGATYTASKTIPDNASDVQLTSSIATEMNTIVQSMEDGFHPFLLSLGNGYHSITIIFYKMGGKTEIIWRDQHWPEEGQKQKVPKTIPEIDESIKGYLASGAKYRARIVYNKKNNPDADIYDHIPEGPAKEQAKKEAEPTARNDTNINLYGKLDPVDKKK
jgi:hypothetical protein